MVAYKSDYNINGLKSETIAAISTPFAVGGISVIRISGSEAFLVADSVFTAKSGERLEGKKGYTACFGEVFGGAQKATPLDECVATVFRAPKSYTGENVVELSCHGGIVNTREVLRAVISAGARIATPGEFTKRAFLNGKLSLTQAEAVTQMINAKTHQALTAARSLHEGALYKRLEGISATLVSVSGSIAAWIDYPEEDLAPIDDAVLLADLKRVKMDIVALLATFDTGKLIFEGIETVIAGKPNVGKSTLMNMLSKEEKSIVTEIAGTTRDVVEERVILGGVMLRLCDTAGIRETEDVVESHGVELAKKRLSNAQLALCIFDATTPPDEQDKMVLNEAIKSGAHVIAVINKIDKVDNIDKALLEAITNAGVCYVAISAKEQIGALDLEKAISDAVQINEIDTGAGILQNERQFEAATRANDALQEAITALENGMTLDAVNVVVEDAIEAVFSLSGKSVSSAVIDNVFSNFCLGK